MPNTILNNKTVLHRIKLKVLIDYTKKEMEVFQESIPHRNVHINVHRDHSTQLEFCSETSTASAVRKTTGMHHVLHRQNSAVELVAHIPILKQKTHENEDIRKEEKVLLL